MKIPKFCKLKKHSDWYKDYPKYRDKWYKINKIDVQHQELSTESFAWIPLQDCKFK